MIIALKYCGGCNPRYDRAACVDKFRKAMRDLNISFVTYNEKEQFDYCLLVSGCNRNCLSDKAFTNCRKLLKVSAAEEFSNIKNELYAQIRDEARTE